MFDRPHLPHHADFLTFDQQFGFGFAKMDMDVEDFRRVHPRQKF